MVSIASIAVVLVLAVVSVNLGGVAADGDLQHQKDKEMCGKLLQVPADTLQQYMRSEYPETNVTFCFIRCVGILSEHYEDGQGLQVDKLFEDANLGKSKEEFTELVNDCQALAAADVSCYCHKAFIPMMCFRKHFHDWKKSTGSEEQNA